VARAAFGELRDGEACILGLDGTPFHGRPEEVDLLLLSRLDCDLRCLELPPVAERELPSLIRYRLRSVYPGSLEHAVVDHVIQRHADGLLAVVSIVKREALEKLRRAAPRAALGLLATALLGGTGARAQGRVLCEFPRYTEVLTFEHGVLLESVLVKRDGAASAERVRRLLGDGSETRVLEMDSIKLPLPRRSASLFRPPRRWKAPRPAVTRGALAAAIVLLGAGVMLRQGGLRQAELSVLRGAILGSQAAGQRTADLVAQYSAASARLTELLGTRPVDVYQFFSDLRDELGPGVLVQDIVLQGGSFQFQAIGPGPLGLMQRFVSDSRFHEVRLLQTTPLADGSRQQFIVTGRYAP